MKMRVLMEKLRLLGCLSIRTAVFVEMSEKFLLADGSDKLFEVERFKVRDILEVSCAEGGKGRGEHG